MTEIIDGGPAARFEADTLKLRNLVVNLGTIFVRLPAASRRKALRIFRGLIFLKKSSIAYVGCRSEDGVLLPTRVVPFWIGCSKEDLQACYAKLRPISKRMAIVWFRWASKRLKNGDNFGLELEALVNELVRRRCNEAGA